MSDNIKVVVKVRPLISREIEDKLSFQWRVKNNTLYQLDASGKESGAQYTFDKVYDEKTKTEDVYKDVAKPIVEAAIAGFNGTIFAYGQTSSGKTYTMSGTEDSPGIIEMAVLNVFEQIKCIPDRDFLVRVSYIEIYNETLKDLLNTENDKVKVRDTFQGVKVEATEKFTSSPEEVMEIMREGEANRQIGATNMNEESSRSHSIFQITIESREHIEGEEIAGSVNVSTLNLVDLAGSERSGQTGATGKRFKEGTHINKSLSVLALVIKQLSEDPHKHANYRDSKLTRILQNSLGGNAKTSIICAVTPAAVEETISTLQFANRAKAIKNKPEVNAVATDATKLQDLTKQLCRLQSELATKNLIEQDNRNLMKQIAGLQKMILNGFGQPSVDMGASRRKTWCAPRRMTISTLHAVAEDTVPNVQRFCTPTLKYNPLSLPNARDFAPIQRPSQLEPVSEEITMITPPKDKKVNFSDEIIDLDSDEENTSNTSRCSPYHKCYNATKTPPCILRKNAKTAEKNLKDIVELTNREKMYNPDVVEYIEKLEQSATTIAKLEENLKQVNDLSLEKDSEMELLKHKISQAENEVKTSLTAKVELEAKCKEYNTKITDLEVSYETLKMKAKLREDELLSLLNEQTSIKQPRELVSGKSLSRTLDKEFQFMDLSKDISLVSDHDSSTSSIGDTPAQLQELVTDMKTQINVKNETIEHLESNLLQQKLIIESLETTCTELREQIFKANNKLDNVEEENSLLKSSIETLNSTIKSQKQSLETANNEIETYNNVIQELESKLLEKNRNVDLNISDNLLESMLAHEETVIANNENLKNIIHSFKIALETRTKEIVNLKSTLECKTSTLDDDIPMMQLQAKEEEINRLIEEVQKSKEQLDENMNIINKLVQDNENLVKNRDDLSEKLFKAESHKIEIEKHNTELEKQNEECNRKLHDFNENHNKLLQNLNDFQGNLSELQREKEELRVLQGEVIMKDNFTADLKSEILTKDNLITSLSSEQAESQDYLSYFKSAVSKLQLLLSVLTGDMCVESEISDDSVAIFTSVYDQLNVAVVKAKEVMTEKDLAVVNNNKLEQEIERLQTQVESLTEDKNEVQNDRDTLKEKVMQHTKDLEGLQNELTELCKEKLDLLTKLQVSDENNQGLVDHITTKEHLITTLQNEKCALRSRIDELLQQNLKQEAEIDNLQLWINNSQARFDDLLRNKDEEILKLKSDSCKRESMLDENYIELQKLSKTLDETTQNRDQILENIYEVATNLANELGTQGDQSLNSSFYVYKSIMQILDNAKDKVLELKSDKSIHKELEEAKQKLGQLNEQNKLVIDSISQTENENKVLTAELEEMKITNNKISKDLLKSDEVIQRLQVELKEKLTVIEELEFKLNEWTINFASLEESMKQQILELQASNLELLSQCSQKDSNETYSVDQISRDLENHQLAVRKSLTNILVEPGNASPQSLLTLCCNKIIDAIQPSQSDLKSITPTTSYPNFEARSAETQTHPCDCDKLLAERDMALEDNLDLKAKLDFLQFVNLNLLKEQEEIRKELKLLVEPAQDLQKKISNHRTNLSTLTATTYAENKLLKSQVKVLQHHNNRFHSVCQRDLPGFKKSLQELSSILKSTSLANRLEANIKRYSLPEVLDRNSSASNFRDESTLDSDLLMLDTNVTVASADNTLLVQDQNGLDGTQIYLDTEINTDLMQTIDPNILHTQLQIMSDENKKLTEKLESFKEENLKLHQKIYESADNAQPDIRKIDAQSSPIKLDGSVIQDPLETTVQICGKLCKYCGNENMLESYEKMTEEIKSLTQELLQVKLQSADFEKKCNDLSADIIENDKLVLKINALEKDNNLKLSEIDQLTKKLKQFNILQEENDVLSTQVMESIDESDSLKRELDILKEANLTLTEKCSDLERLVKCTSAQLTTATCLKCGNSASASPVSTRSTLNRSRSDSESSSCFNKLSTLQNELLASREDCKTISEDVATIKSHFEDGNLSISHNMELDDSMGEPNIFTFSKEHTASSKTSSKLNVPPVLEERPLDIYDLEKIDCFSYYVEITGAETNLNQDTKIVDVMKMLYSSLIAKHGNEVENLVNKLKDFEESRNELHEKINNITTEYSKISEEITDKNKRINDISNVFYQIRNNISILDKELSGSDAEKNTALVIMFKENLLNILDKQFELSSVSTFESLIDRVVNKHQNDLIEIMTRYSELQGNMELLTTELSNVTDNLSQMKCQLSDKEKEYNLLKTQKERVHEITNAVTLDIVQKDRELNEIISKGCQTLLKCKIFTPAEIDFNLPVNKNVSDIIEKLIQQSKQMDLVSQEKHNLVLDITKSKTVIEEKEEEVECLKSEITKLRELCKNATSELVIKNEALENLNSLHHQLKEVYEKKTEENSANVKIIENLTHKLAIMKETIDEKERSLQALQVESCKQDINDSETKAKISELVDSITNLEYENKKLKSLNEMITNESEQNTLQLAKADDTIKNNKCELDKMTAEILALNQSLKESLSVIDSLKLEAKSVLEENAALKKQYEEVNQLCSQLKLNIKTHEKTAEIQCKTINRLKQEKQKNTSPDTEKIKQLEELTQKCEALRKECASLTEDLDKAKREAVDLKDEKELLERRISDLEAQLEAAHHTRVSIGSGSDNARRRRQSLLDSKRALSDDKQETDHKKMEAFFSTAVKPEEMFMDVDDNSNRSTPVRSRRSGSFHSKNEESDRDEGGSRPGSALARRRRRQSLHDMHRNTLPPPQDHLNTLDEINKLNNGNQDSELSQLKQRLELCQQELEDLRERYREVDAECETCAEYLRERDEQCMQLTNHNKALQQEIKGLNEKLQNASMNRSHKDSKRSFANVSVNTDEDWTNLHSVVVDRMSFDREVEKNKSLQRSVDELRFKNSELKATLAKMQKSAERAARNKADLQALEATKLELQACKRELEQYKERCAELDEECDTCAEYLRERDDQLCRLKEAKDALEAKLEALLEKEAGNKAQSVRKKRQSVHDQNRNSAVQCADAATETSEDLLSYQVERDNDSKLQYNEMQQLKMAMEKLTQQKTALEMQLRAVTSSVPMMPPVYVATGSAIVQNQHLTDIMKENQKLKKMNAKLITICKKRGKPLSESNRENDDPAEMG